MSGHAKMPPASHNVSATSLKLLIQQIHPLVRVERDSGMCVARDLYELWGRSPYTRMCTTLAIKNRLIIKLLKNRFKFQLKECFKALNYSIFI